MAKPYTGLRVLDLTSTVAGAVTTMLLADFGAAVTMAHPADGHPLRGEEGFKVWRRGKTALLANVRTPSGQRAIRELAASVDVLVDDLPPGALDRLGLAPETLAAANPRLIHASITACGTRGPWRDLPADESLVTALSSIMRRQPGFREGPVYFVLPLCSYAAALLAMHGIGASLVARDRAGNGARVETSLLAGALAQSGASFVITEKAQPFDALARLALGAMPLYRLYQCQDSRWLHLGAINARFWPKIALAVDRPELISDDRFQLAPRMRDNDARHDLITILAAEFDRRPFAEWDRILDEHDVPYAPAQTVDEFMRDPQVRHQQMVITVDDPDVGPMEQPAPPIKFQVGSRKSEVGSQSGPRTMSTTTGQPSDFRLLTSDAPLRGVRILDVSQYIAGPYGGSFLADLGADVIKVEGPDGDGLRGLHGGFLAWNRGKRGICLDLRTEAGRDAYLRLAATVDVVLDNMRPGVAERLGIGYEDVCKVNPRIIYCYVSAYGSTGPYRHKPGVDPLMQARSGIEREQGGMEGPPVFLAPPVTDNTAAMLNAVGILGALYHRDRTGEGQFLETSLLMAACLLESDAMTAYDGRPPRPANDVQHLGPHALRRLYQCRDGWLMLACKTERDWQQLCAALRRPEWRDDPLFATAESRTAHDRALAEAIGARLASMTLARAMAALRRHHVPAAPATGECETIDDPQFLENGYAVRFRHADLGGVRQSAGLVRVNGAPPALRATAPLLGGDTREVLTEAGFTQDEIAALLASGVAIQADTASSK